jgi:hypothetical protein
MGAHQHQPDPAPPQGRQTLRAQGLGRQGHQAIDQAGGRLQQRPLALLHQQPQRSSKSLQLLGPLGIHDHHGLRSQLLQAAAEQLHTARSRGGIQLRQTQQPHLLRRHHPLGFLLHPGRQMAAAEPEQAIAGERGGVHGLPVQQMNTIHRGAAPGQKRRRQQGQPEGAQLLADHLELQRKVPPQGGIATADHQPLVQQPLSHRRGQGRPQGPADLLDPLARRLRVESAGIGEHKQQRRGMGQALPQAGRIPTQQQRTAVHRLRSGGIVVDHDDFQPHGHGTIVP